LRGGYQGNRGGSRGGEEGSKERRNLRLDDRTGRLAKEHLHRDDRRQLFQAKVEEEQRQKMLRAALAARHTQCCRLLGLHAPETPMLPHYPEFYLSGGKWIPMPAPPLPVPDEREWIPPLMAVLPPEAYRPGDPPLPHPRQIYPPGVCPEEPPPPSPPPPRTPEATDTFQDICKYYDRLYYRGEAGEALEDRVRAASRSPSPPISSKRARLSPVSCSPLLPSISPPPGSVTTLSPGDYRSPSPVSRPTTTSLVTPSLSRSPPREEEDELCSQPLSSSTLLPPGSPVLPLPPSHPVGPPLLEARLQPKWRATRDPASGRLYYYHKVTRLVQWMVPWWSGPGLEGVTESPGKGLSIETNDTDNEEERGEDGEDTDTEDDSDEEDVDITESKDEGPEDEQIPDSDLSASEKRMLMRMRGRTKEERTTIRRMKKERDKERREQERVISRERHTRHRRDGLVMEHLVPARISEKDKVDLMTFKEMRERLINKDKIRDNR